MNKKEAIEFLEKSLKETSHLRRLHYDDEDFGLWISKIKNVIKAGLNQDDYETFDSAYSIAIPMKGMWTENKSLEYYKENITRRETGIKKIIQKYEILGIEAEPALEKLVTQDKPKAFIAHEGETRALSTLKEFLEAFNIKYFIAEAEASDGRSIEKQVDWNQAQGDFAICLATKGKAINKKTGKHYMGLNIADELGRARLVYGNHIILLIQKGVEVHSNLREIVHESFTSTNMEKAFIKIAKELSNWGFIRAGKVETGK